MKRSLLKILVSSFLAVFSVTASHADERSSALLKELSAKIASLGNYHVGFTVTAEGSLSEGEYVVSGDKYYMLIEDIEVICDGKNKYEINNMDDEVIIGKVDVNEVNILSNPTRAFDFADEGFTHVYDGEMTEKCQACNIILLEPRGKDSSIKDIVLAIEKTTGLPYMLRYSVEGIDGEVEVFVKEFSADRKTPASRFTFDKKNYKGYEIIDFR